MSSACPFCQPDTLPVLENALALACFDKHPVTQGHMLVLTRRHVASWFEAAAQERLALISLLDECRELLDERFHPDGYNVGTNVGVVSGQTIPHLHIHLIPRYTGDCADPRGGVRGVIPSKQWYPLEGEKP